MSDVQVFAFSQFILTGFALQLARRSQLTKLSVQELQTLLKRAEIEQREAAVVEQTKLDFERQLSSKADERRRGWWSQPNDDDDKSGEFARKRDAVQHRLQG